MNRHPSLVRLKLTDHICLKQGAGYSPFGKHTQTQDWLGGGLAWNLEFRSIEVKKEPWEWAAQGTEAT